MPDSASQPERSHTECIVHAARNGDVDRFNQLYARIAPVLRTWVEIQLTQYPTIDVNDAIQEVWWRACSAFAKQRDSGQPSAPFRPWLFVVAKNVLFEAIRHARRGPQAKPPQRDDTDRQTMDRLSASGLSPKPRNGSVSVWKPLRSDGSGYSSSCATGMLGRSWWKKRADNDHRLDRGPSSGQTSRARAAAPLPAGFGLRV